MNKDPLLDIKLKPNEEKDLRIKASIDNKQKNKAVIDYNPSILSKIFFLWTYKIFDVYLI